MQSEQALQLDKFLNRSFGNESTMESETQRKTFKTQQIITICKLFSCEDQSMIEEQIRQVLDWPNLQIQELPSILSEAIEAGLDSVDQRLKLAFSQHRTSKYLIDQKDCLLFSVMVLNHFFEVTQKPTIALRHQDRYRNIMSFLLYERMQFFQFLEKYFPFIIKTFTMPEFQAPFNNKITSSAHFSKVFELQRKKNKHSEMQEGDEQAKKQELFPLLLIQQQLFKTRMNFFKAKLRKKPNLFEKQGMLTQILLILSCDSTFSNMLNQVKSVIRSIINNNNNQILNTYITFVQAYARSFGHDNIKFPQQEIRKLLFKGIEDAQLVLFLDKQVDGFTIQQVIHCNLAACLRKYKCQIQTEANTANLDNMIKSVIGITILHQLAHFLLKGLVQNWGNPFSQGKQHPQNFRQEKLNFRKIGYRVMKFIKENHKILKDFFANIEAQENKAMLIKIHYLIERRISQLIQEKQIKTNNKTGQVTKTKYSWREIFCYYFCEYDKKTFFTHFIGEYMNIHEDPAKIPINFSYGLEDSEIWARLMAQLSEFVDQCVDFFDPFANVSRWEPGWIIENTIFRNLKREKRLTSKDYEILRQLGESEDPQKCFDLRLQFGLKQAYLPGKFWEARYPRMYLHL